VEVKLASLTQANGKFLSECIDLRFAP